MALVILSILPIIVVALVALRFGPDRTLKGVAWAQVAMIAGLVPLGLQILVLALFGFGEMLSGDLSGAGHLLPLAAVALMGFLAWKRPLEGGAALVLVGIVVAVAYPSGTAMMIMAAPQLLGGVLFLAVGVAARRVSRHEGVPRP